MRQSSVFKHRGNFAFLNSYVGYTKIPEECTSLAITLRSFLQKARRLVRNQINLKRYLATILLLSSLLIILAAFGGVVTTTPTTNGTPTLASNQVLVFPTVVTQGIRVLDLALGLVSKSAFS